MRVSPSGGVGGVKLFTLYHDGIPVQHNLPSGTVRGPLSLVHQKGNVASRAGNARIACLDMRDLVSNESPKTIDGCQIVSAPTGGVDRMDVVHRAWKGKPQPTD